MALSDNIKSAPSKMIDSFKKMEKKKKVRLIVLTFLIIAVIAAVSVVLNQKTYTVLYSGMEASDTGKVLSVLSEMGVDAKTQGEDTILVPEDSVDEIRLELAAQGYPSSGVNDYSIYSSVSGLSTTDSERQVYYKYQLQANLRATIMKMEKIEDAVVNLDLGEESSFVVSSDKKPATASIMLTMKDGETLSKSEAKTIRELVSKSISGLTDENISIVDSRMNLYTAEDEDETETVNSHLALQNSVQDQLKQQVVSLLGPVFGEDNVIAEVNVTLNFDAKNTESVEYSTPAGSTEGIVVSMKELVEAITNDAGSDVSGIDANGNASQYLSQLEESDDAVYYNVSREVNYEINQTTTQIEEAQGQIENLSVSVILNSADIGDYEEEVRNLVATAIGADVKNVTVGGLSFDGMAAENEADAQAAEAADAYAKQVADSEQLAKTIRLAILSAAGLAVMLFLFLIVRTLRPKKKKKKQAAVGGIDIQVGDRVVPGSAPDDKLTTDLGNKDDNLSALEDYIAKNPESAANLLRNWLNEE